MFSRLINGSWGMMGHIRKILAILALMAGGANGGQSWTVSNASFELTVKDGGKGRVAVGTVSTDLTRGRGSSALSSAEFLVIDEQVVSFVEVQSSPQLLGGQVIRLSEGVVVSAGGASVTVHELVVYSDESTRPISDSTLMGGLRLELRGVRVRLDQATGQLIVPALEVRVSEGLALSLGDSSLAGVSLGSGVVRGSMTWAGGASAVLAESSSSSDLMSPLGGTTSGGFPVSPDVTFCELYGLNQFGRQLDVVGLALTTTSWNRGNADLTWLAYPDARHPFIVQNLYRIKQDRFEQIGQSWIKHGFFALANLQCGGSCTFEALPGHQEGPYLGIGCTDTYTSGLNAFQSGLGPREEVNPWTAAYDPSTSEISTSHGHSAIAHRLQVHDDDLDPGQNLASRYIAEGYYVHFEDSNPLNSAAWKEITSISGSPGGTWSFSMPSLGNSMEIGFALNAWTGSEETILAEEIPVVKGVSPDGRCVLRSKATDNGDGTWHYEYAMLNMDMDRKGQSFTVPIDATNVITDIDFHAVESHDESFDNVPWTSAISSDCPVGDRCIKWETVNNPLRWGTVYNFRFDANAPPQPGAGGDVRGATVVLGLFDPGVVTSVSGLSVGPAVSSLITVAPMEAPVPDAVGSQFAKSRLISFAGPLTDVGISTALRIELSSLHHPLLPATAPDFTSFEGQLRYVNLYRDSNTGEPIFDCEDSAAIGSTFKCATIGCTPEYADWATLYGGDVLHVSGSAIVPSSTYNLSTLSGVCVGQEATCTTVSVPLAIETSVWGTVDDNPLLNVADILGVVDTLKFVPPPFFEPRSLLRGDVPDPQNATQNIFDVTLCVDAVKGAPYPHPGPQVCP